MNPLIAATFFLACLGSENSEYDPLKTSPEIEIIDTEFQYGEDSRVVPLKLYLPDGNAACPVILFSHGLGGSREVGRYLGEHWAGCGYAVVMMQHAGSDSSVWKDSPRSQRLSALKEAANGVAFLARVKDVPATIDQLEKWNQKDGRFQGRFDLASLGMSGHSFGAVTTQAVAGQSFARLGPVYTDKRIQAAVAFSPSPPQVGDAGAAFSSVNVPWLLMTGTKDKSVIGRATPESRRKVFAELPQKGHSYELVLYDAEHMAFSDRTILGLKHRNPDHHRIIKALTTAFWDAYLRKQSSAKAWLDGDDAKQLLNERDEWLKK